MKNLKGWNIYICSAFLLASTFLAPCDAFSQGKEFAVEVAALSSRDCAVELVNGLAARGLDAYWLKTAQSKFGDYYRVRVGKFSNLDMARRFADKLLDSGLLDTCSITAYEAPLYSLMMEASKKKQAALLPIEMRSTPIGAYCPINLTDKNSINRGGAIAGLGLNEEPSGTVKPAASNTDRSGASDRDLALKNAMDNVIASTQAAMSSIRPKVSMAINLTAVDTGINKVVDNLVSERGVDTRKEQDREPEIRTSRQLANVASTPSMASFLSRSEPISIAGGGRPTGRAISDAGPGSGPRLRGVLEMNNGQMVLKLRNLDQQRSFTGVARLTLGDDNSFDDIAPVPIELNPEEEKVVPINDVKRAYGDLMLMVYDQRQTVQLIRNVPFGQRPKEQRPVVAANRAEAEQPPETFEGGAPPVDNAWKLTDSGGTNSPSVEVSGGSLPGLPNVTGTFDATKPPVTEAAPPGVPGDSNGALQNANPNANQDVPPGQLFISPRQISSTNESVSMELGIAGSQPIGYVKVSIRAGTFQDEKVAVLPSANGSVPFLVPTKDATGQYSYEIRNEAGKVIGSGVQNFNPLGPDS